MVVISGVLATHKLKSNQGFTFESKFERKIRIFWVDTIFFWNICLFNADKWELWGEGLRSSFQTFPLVQNLHSAGIWGLIMGLLMTTHIVWFDSVEKEEQNKLFKKTLNLLNKYYWLFSVPGELLDFPCSELHAKVGHNKDFLNRNYS